MIQGTGFIFASLLFLIIILFAVNKILRSNPNSFLQQFKAWIYFGIIFLGLTIIFALLPIEGSAKNSVFSLLGILVTAVIAVSSTTFASNAMAGIMLRIIRNFKMGDFIEVDEHFGRVSEIGLLHTEIQTKTRNLTTLPNIYLVNNAVTVTPHDKVLISTTLTLGYDVSHYDVENILKEAADKINLSDAFVQVVDLGNYSIKYRVAGFLDNPKLMLSAKSNLNKQIIDSLHGKDIEIVSPTFMNQRHYKSDDTFISEVKRYQERKNKNNEKSNVFDKADTAEEIEKLKVELKKATVDIKNIDNNSNKKQYEILENKIKELTNKISSLELLFIDSEEE